jgi:aspartyl/asparaginyl-tRNA synthetase
MKEPNPMMSSSVKGAKTFEQSIVEEIIEEMREDAETHVLSQCKKKYKDIVSMSYFKIEKGLEKEGFKGNFNNNQDDFQLADEKVWKRDKIVVMGAILYPLDSKNFQTMIAIVGEDG